MTKKNKPTVHVVKGDSGWNTKISGNSRPSSTHDTKADALNYGKSLAQAYQTELVIHGRDGKIQDKDSFGPDPYPPRDRKH